MNFEKLVCNIGRIPYSKNILAKYTIGFIVISGRSGLLTHLRKLRASSGQNAWAGRNGLVSFCSARHLSNRKRNIKILIYEFCKISETVTSSFVQMSSCCVNICLSSRFVSLSAKTRSHSCLQRHTRDLASGILTRGVLNMP